MGFLTAMIKVARLEGVDHYILADGKGEVIIHNLKDYQKMGQMISFCGNQAVSLGRNRLQFLTFKREYDNDLFIFPIGKYYLGVVKDTQVKADELTTTLLKFLDGLREEHAIEQGES